ncbi:GNAT family N-acetyltransferase [Actinacidiphila alni]|uniref:GNAT family N-acetyltransferase n=1 Tax=Actinacidiphila alni TaxID=380248 RepID=UPI0034530583
MRATRTGAGWALRAATADDVETIAELRAVVMRPDLERLGRYDEVRVRQRFRDSFSGAHTSVITVEGDTADGLPDDAADGVGDDVAGCVTLRPAPGGGLLLEHFYLAPALHGRGLGSAVLAELLRRADERGDTVRLTVLQGSPARRLYERWGFVREAEDPVDVLMVRTPR